MTDLITYPRSNAGIMEDILYDSGESFSAENQAKIREALKAIGSKIEDNGKRDQFLELVNQPDLFNAKDPLNPGKEGTLNRDKREALGAGLIEALGNRSSDIEIAPYKHRYAYGTMVGDAFQIKAVLETPLQPSGDSLANLRLVTDDTKVKTPEALGEQIKEIIRTVPTLGSTATAATPASEPAITPLPVPAVDTAAVSQKISDIIDVDTRVLNVMSSRTNTEKKYVLLDLGEIPLEKAKEVSANFKKFLQGNGHAEAMKNDDLRDDSIVSNRSGEFLLALNTDYVAKNSDALVTLFQDKKEQIDAIIPQSARDINMTKAEKEFAAKVLDDNGLFTRLPELLDVSIEYDRRSRKLGIDFPDQESAEKFKEALENAAGNEKGLLGATVKESTSNPDQYALEFNAEPLVGDKAEDKTPLYLKLESSASALTAAIPQKMHD